MLPQSIVFMDHPVVLDIIRLIIWDFITTHGIRHIITDHHFTLDLAGAGEVTAMVILIIRPIIIPTMIIGMDTIMDIGMDIMPQEDIMIMGITHIMDQGPHVEVQTPR